MNYLSSFTTKSPMSTNHPNDPPGTKRNREKKLISVLTGILKVHKRLHFEMLCLYNGCSDTEVADYFQSYFNLDKYNFFRNHPKYFSIGIDGYVSLCNDDDAQNMNCSRALPSDKFRRGGLSIQSKSTVPLNENVRNKGQRSNTSLLSNTSSCVLEVIDILVGALNVSQLVHYEKLCKYNDQVENFFMSYSTSEKFKFYKGFPEYFYLVSHGYVRLSTNIKCHSNLKNVGVSTTISKNPISCAKNINSGNNKTKDKNNSFAEPLQEKSSHVSDHEVDTSNHLMLDINKDVCLPKYASDNLNIMPITKSTSVSLVHVLEEEIIGILIGALTVSQRVHYEKLCKYNYKVKNFFLSYSTSEKFKFYKRFPKYFYLAGDGFVRLSTNDTYHSSLKDVSVFTTITKNPITCAKGTINFGNNKTKDENYSSVGPLQERSFHVSNHETGGSSNHLILDVNDAESYVKSKIINEEIVHPNRSKSADDYNNNSISSAYNVDTFIAGKENSRSSYRNNCADSQINNTTILKDTSSSGREKKIRDETCHNHNCKPYSAAKSHPVNNKENVADEPNHSSKQIYETLEGRLSRCKISAIQSINKLKVNCDAVIGSQIGGIDSTSIVQEVMETMIDQLKNGKCMHYLKFYEVSEECNGLVKSFFYTFPDTEKLSFLKSFPQYFLVNENNFVKLSDDMNISTSNSATCEENVNYSSVYASPVKQSEKVTNLEDSSDSGSCVTFNEECLYNSEKNYVERSHFKHLLASDSSHNQDTVDDNDQRSSS